MKKLVVLLLVSLMATSAFATIDPDTNSIGVYFDTAAETVEYEATANVPFNAYVCITNPSEAEVHGLEFAYEIAVPAGMEALWFRLDNSLPAQAIDIGVNTNKASGFYVVGLASPLPATASVPFITWQFMVLSPGMTLEFFIGASPVPSVPDYDGPVYEAGGYLVTLGQSSGSADAPVALVNTTGVVAVEETSFGSVKSLFR